MIIGHEWSAATPGVARRSTESSEMQRFRAREYDFQSILDERGKWEGMRGGINC